MKFPPQVRKKSTGTGKRTCGYSSGGNFNFTTMKKATKITLALFLSISVFGNDGTYLTRGGVIYPTKESRISLEKEILSFTVQNRICSVDILFEFNNPDNADRKLLIGFQAPSGGGDVDDDFVNMPQITDFRIIANEQILPHTIKKAECEDCELKDLNELQFYQGNSGVYVYLFEITFKPGTNKINHSYSFPASSSVNFSQIYNYILTTGAKWAGGTIKNLTVQFDLGENKYFYVDNDVFGENANWLIVGSGKIANKAINFYDVATHRMVRILSGKLQIDVKDFKPTKNIEFGLIGEELFYPIAFDGKYSIRHWELYDDENYTKEELKILRNIIYAQYGYTFKNKELHDYFSQFEWYMPDPNLRMEQIKLTEKERNFIDEIIKREKD
jgi:hypothetical protein